MNKNVILLSLCQAFYISGLLMLASFSIIIGKQLAPYESWASFPLGFQFGTVMLTTFPAAYLMKWKGRKFGFMVGALLGFLAGCVLSYAIYQESFVFFILGSMLSGSFACFCQFFRFAAAEAVEAKSREISISMVIAGGVVAALLGVYLTTYSQKAFSVPFLGCFIVFSLLCLGMMILLSQLNLPPIVEEKNAGSPRPWSELFQQPILILAILGATVSYGVMNLVMAATPLAMNNFQHSLEDTAFVIQWHLLGMTVPSFVAGYLIKRFGAPKIMVTGVLFLGACVLFSSLGTELIYFWTALLVLGIGWNFLFIGSTTLLTKTYRPEEKAKVQAFNDFCISGVVMVTSFSSGALLHWYGWEIVNWGAIPLLALTLLSSLWLDRYRKALSI